MRSKRTLLAIILISCICWSVGWVIQRHFNEDRYYANAFLVTEINRENDTVTICSPTGFSYQFYGCEDWCEGYICVAIMDNMGTEEILDDRINAVQYAGIAEDFVIGTGF